MSLTNLAEAVAVRWRRTAALEPQWKPVRPADETGDIADVCLVLEGTYPYVTGGVSSWTHDVILAQPDLRFHLVTLLAPNSNLTPRYKVPRNVIGQTNVFLQEMPRGEDYSRRYEGLFQRLEEPLTKMLSGGGLADLALILDAIRPHRGRIGGEILLNSKPAWDTLTRVYKRQQPHSSFLDYFWGWRALLGGLYSVLLCDLPYARCYHTVCTGYAGLFAARARIESRRPVLLTEHGIYTNERRIEIAMADWLHESAQSELSIEKTRSDVRDLWVGTFISYSKACYEACAKIITLYEGNQFLQKADGADPSKLMVIPNGIDCAAFDGVEREGFDRNNVARPPTVALIGRVVPIKDVKTYIRAVGILKETLPNLRAFVLGPTDEDKDYFAECEAMVRHMGLTETVLFTGRVKLHDYLGKIDVIALTSISEAQPLVILEAGAFGIPSVATNVGACEEMILGSAAEDPPLGAGGVVTPLANPMATAEALARLLTDAAFYEQCSRAVKARLLKYYDKRDLDRAYRELYAEHCGADDLMPVSSRKEQFELWPVSASFSAN